MRIAVHLTVDVNPAAWEREYGVPRDQLRDDLRLYILNMVQSMLVEPDKVEVR